MRENPYKSTGKTTVVSKAKHEAEIMLYQKKVDTLSKEVDGLRKLVSSLESSQSLMKNNLLNLEFERVRADRAEAIIDKLIGFVK